MTTPCVEIESLRFGYEPGTCVIDVPELRVAAGERVFLHGPSGSGKTTFLGLMSGILRPQSGRVCVMGEDLGAMSGSARDRYRGESIGYIFQMFNLIPYLSVAENILLPCHLSRKRLERYEKHAGTNDVQAMAERLGIADFLSKPVTSLSVGQQQRVAAARALVGSPPLIVADEPTSALDSDHRETFLQLLFEEATRSDAAIVFVSHDRDLARLFSRSVSLAEINRAGGVS